MDHSCLFTSCLSVHNVVQNFPTAFENIRKQIIQVGIKIYQIMDVIKCRTC